MKTVIQSRHAMVAALIAVGSLSGTADGAVTINLWEDGTNVRGQASGTLNITGMTSAGNSAYPSDFRIQPNGAEVLFFGPGDLYTGIITAPNFGAGTIDVSGVSTGDHFGFEVSNLVVPTGFVSGGTIFSEGVFSSTTLATLGANIGTYTFVLPNDTISLVIGQAPVPEPSASLLLGLGALGFALRRKRRI